MESLIDKMNNLKIKPRKPIKKRIINKGKLMIIPQNKEKNLHKMFNWYIPKKYRKIMWKDVRDNLLGEYSEYQTAQLIKLKKQLENREEQIRSANALARLMNSMNVKPKPLVRMAFAVVEKM